MEGEESGGAPAKKNYICVNLTTSGTTACKQRPRLFKVCRTNFNIGHGGKNDISQHIKSQWYIRAAEAQKGNTNYKHTKC